MASTEDHRKRHPRRARFVTLLIAKLETAPAEAYAGKRSILHATWRALLAATRGAETAALQRSAWSAIRRSDR